jgi:peroxiredoxin
MAIKVGDKIPSVTLKRLGESGMEEVDTAEIFAGKTMILFAVPGAFTPTCTEKHMPSYLAKADDFKAKGIEIMCLSVNDPFVMNAWSKQLGCAGKISMLPDGNGDFAKTLGLTFDGAPFYMGTRAQRFAMLVENGIVKDLQIEAPGEFKVSSADNMCERLAA